jgi:hypothetical protein
LRHSHALYNPLSLMLYHSQLGKLCPKEVLVGPSPFCFVKPGLNLLARIFPIARVLLAVDTACLTVFCCIGSKSFTRSES